MPPFNVSQYNVIPTNDARAYAEQQRQEAQQQQQEHLNKLGLSEQQFSYLKSHGISENRYTEMQHSGYSRDAIFYLADTGKDVQLSKNGIDALNKVLSGGRLEFKAHTMDADSGRFSDYYNEKTLLELAKVFPVPIGKEEKIVFENGQVSASSVSGVIYSEKAGGRPLEISKDKAEQNLIQGTAYIAPGAKYYTNDQGEKVYYVSLGTEETKGTPLSKAGIENGQRIYMTPEGQKVKLQFGAGTGISLVSSNEQQLINKNYTQAISDITSAVTGKDSITGIVSHPDLALAQNTLNSAKLSSDQRAELQNYIAQSVFNVSAPSGKEIVLTTGKGEVSYHDYLASLPAERKAEVKAYFEGTFFPELETQANVQAAKFYGVSGKFYEVSKAGVLNPTDLGTSIQAKPEKFGLSPFTIFTDTGGMTLTPKAWIEAKNPIITDSLKPYSQSIMKNPDFYKVDFAQLIIKDRALGQPEREAYAKEQSYGNFVALFDVAILEMKNKGEDLFGKTWEQQYKDYTNSPGEWRVPMTQAAYEKGGRFVETDVSIKAPISPLYPQWVGGEGEVIKAQKLVIPQEDYEKGFLNIDLTIPPLVKKEYFDIEGEELIYKGIGEHGWFYKESEKTYSGNKSQIYEVVTDVSQATKLSARINPFENLVLVGTEFRFVASDIILGTTKAGLGAYLGSVSAYKAGQEFGKELNKAQLGMKYTLTPEQGVYNIKETARAAVEPLAFYLSYLLLSKPVFLGAKIPVLSETGGLTNWVKKEVGIKITPTIVGAGFALLGAHSEYQRTGDIEKAALYGLGTMGVLKSSEVIAKVGRSLTGEAESGILGTLRNVFWEERVVGEKEMLQMRGLSESQAKEFVKLNEKSIERSISYEEQ